MGLLDLLAEETRQNEARVRQFAEMAGCTMKEAWEHWEIVKQERFYMPERPETRH